MFTSKQKQLDRQNSLLFLENALKRPSTDKLEVLALLKDVASLRASGVIVGRKSNHHSYDVEIVNGCIVDIVEH